MSQKLTSSDKTLTPKQRTVRTASAVLSYTAHRGETISLLSSEATKQADYRGFINLAILFLLISNARMVIENLNKYGWMLRSPFSVMFEPVMVELGFIVFGYIAFV
jgi:hypothetical protein